MARKSKYTPETVAKILEAIKMGATYDLAAGYAGVHYDTFNEWRKGKSEFSEQLKNAEGIAAMIWLAKIERAASDGEWQAAAWKLERRYPHSYGKTVQAQEHSGPDGGPIQHEVTNVHADTLNTKLDRIAARITGATSTSGTEEPAAG